MANQQSTPLSCPQNTILSRRITSGTAHFREIPAVWSSWQGPEPCRAFDVTWDRLSLDPATQFRGYAIRVKLSTDVEAGQLTLVALGDEYRLGILQCDGAFTDAATQEPLAEPVTVIGPVVEESEYLIAAQALVHGGYDAVKAAVEAGFAISELWEQDDNAEFDVVTATTALGQTPAYRLAEKDYRGSDAEPLDSDSDEDFARRLFGARCFAAGRASARIPV